MKKYVLTLDLKNDPKLIEAYEAYHRSVWPEIEQSIRESGIRSMEIFRWATRLVMTIETEDDFSFEKKKSLDSDNQKVREWEELMSGFQQRLQGAGEDEKWVQMKPIYKLE